MSRGAVLRLFILATAIAVAGAAWAQSAAFFSPNRWGLVIGAGNYPHLGDLQYAASDADLFAQTLKSSYSFEASQVSVLTDSGAEEKRPTAQRIRAELDRILASPRLQKSDLFVFYFSGHGISVKGKDLLMATDAKVEEAEKFGLPVQDVVASIVKAGVQNVLIVTDACRSGEKNQFGNELIKLGKEANIAILLGCAPGGRSYELPREKHGALTHCLVRAMEDEGLRDTTTGALWASNVADRVKADVETVTAKEQGRDFRQVPSVWCEKNQDIFLGGFVGRGGVSPEVLDQVKQKGEGLTPEVYGRYLIALGNTALVAAEPDIAVQATRLFRGLGLKDGLAYAIEAVATDALGRSVEAEAAYKRLNTEFPEHYTAYLYRTLYAETLKARREAAEVMLAKFGDFVPAYTLYLATSRDHGLDPEATSKLLQRLTDTFPPGSGEREYFRLLRDARTEKSKEIIKTFDFPDLDGIRPEYMEMLAYDLAEATGDEAQILAMVQRILERTSYPHNWEAIERQHVISVVPQDQWEKTGLYLIANARGPERVWTALHLLLRSLDKHADAFAKAEQRFPYAWKAQSAAWLSKLAQQKQKRFEIPERLLAAGLDKPANRAQLYFMMAVSLELDWAAWEYDLADSWCRQIVTDLAINPDPQSADYWGAAMVSAYRLIRPDFLEFCLARDYDKEITVNSDVHAISVDYLFNNGQGGDVAEILRFMDPGSPETADALLQLCAWLAINGELQRAREVLEPLNGPNSPPTVKILASLVAAVEGKPRSVEDLASIPGVGSLDTLLLGLAEAVRPDANLETVKTALEVGMADYMWLHAELLKRMAAKGGEEQLEGVASQLLVRTEPPYRDIQIKQLPAMEPKGELEFSARVSLKDLETVTGTLKVTWDGKAATVTLVADKSTLTWTGTLSPNGHIRATGQFDGAPSQFDIRILPKSWITKQESVYGVARFINSKGIMGVAHFSSADKK